MTLDVYGEHPLLYANGGANELKDVVTKCDLEDHRRTQLDEQPEYTRHGTNNNKKLVKTRIDRFYTPMYLTLQHHLTFDVCQDLIFKDTPSDHQIVILNIAHIAQKFPKKPGRKHINEDIVLDSVVQQRILKILNENMSRTNKHRHASGTHTTGAQGR